MKHSAFTNDSLNHVDSVLAHLVSECEDINDAFCIGLIQQAIQSYECSSSANTSTEQAIILYQLNGSIIQYRKK